jgi:hypothetical protein
MKPRTSRLRRHRDVVDALASALLANRVLNAEQIDEAIARAVAERQLAQEYERRRKWCEIKARADNFTELCRGA